jgi:hypothetical protein
MFWWLKKLENSKKILYRRIEIICIGSIGNSSVTGVIRCYALVASFANNVSTWRSIIRGRR